jgi:hypothetical protein
MNQTKVKNPLDGKKFSRLTVLSRADDRITPNGSKRVIYTCRCDCGSMCEVESSSLKDGKSKSCGCLRDERVRESNTRHGYSRRNSDISLYHVWRGMIRRCTDKKDLSYSGYGGRGITVCKEWLEIDSFMGWAKSNYKKGLQIDRIDNDKGYSPENCRFVTPLVNVGNQRLLRSDNNSEYRGVSYRKDRGKWESYVNREGKRKRLGLFINKEDAAKARDAYVIENKLDLPLNFS